MASIGPSSPASQSGGLQAIVGTVEQVAIAMAISVPLGVLTAVYLNEVHGRLRRPVRIFVDAMSGVPSIVAGLFIYAVLVAGGGQFSGFAAAIALSILMLPTVTRTCEVVLRLVPDGLREASLAMGAPEWRTVWRVVLPTARSGIITAMILGVARVIGETAPLLMTSLGNPDLNLNPFRGPQASLPLASFKLFTSSQQADVARAWTFAAVLLILVLILFVLARRSARTQFGR
jgi:phosphate transport system permease protein